MKDYRRGAHTVFEIHLPGVWTTQSRRPALTGEVALRVRDLSRESCGQPEVTILKGHVAKAQLPRFRSSPPPVTSRRVMQWLKGKTASKWLGELPHWQKQFWGRPRWARGYVCCSSGTVTDEVIAE